MSVRAPVDLVHFPSLPEQVEPLQAGVQELGQTQAGQRLDILVCVLLQERAQESLAVLAEAVRRAPPGLAGAGAADVVAQQEDNRPSSEVVWAPARVRGVLLQSRLLRSHLDQCI